MHSDHHQPFYHYPWALAVAEEFAESMYRGTYRVAKSLGISYSEVVGKSAALIQTNHRRWRIYKKTVKLFEYMEREEWQSVLKHPEYQTYVRWMAQENWLDQTDENW